MGAITLHFIPPFHFILVCLDSKKKEYWVCNTVCVTVRVCKPIQTDHYCKGSAIKLTIAITGGFVGFIDYLFNIACMQGEFLMLKAGSIFRLS